MRRVSLFFVLGEVVALVISGCAAAPSPVSSATQPISTESLYEQDWVWQTDAGKPFQFSELRGHPQVIAMFFTSCTGTCGVTVNRLLQLDASLPADQRRDVGFVLVSFDSENDTPRELARYRAQRQIPPDWKMMRGSRQATEELADELGVRFAPDPARHILHSAQITVLDRQGRIVNRVVGVNTDLTGALTSIAALESKTGNQSGDITSAQ